MAPRSVVSLAEGPGDHMPLGSSRPVGAGPLPLLTCCHPPSEFFPRARQTASSILQPAASILKLVEGQNSMIICTVIGSPWQQTASPYWAFVPQIGRHHRSYLPEYCIGPYF